MNADVFAEWLRRQGFDVIRSENSYWFNQGPRVYQAFPYHWVISPSEDEIIQLLRANNLLGVRYSTPYSAQLGRASYHAVYEGSNYTLESLGKSARKNIRRGLQNCTVELIDFELLARDGWKLQQDTLSRQGRETGLTKKRWESLTHSANQLSGFEAWGAFVGLNLAASVITFQMSDWVYMLYQQCHRDYLSAHVNNALSFTVTHEIMKRKNIRSILYGLHSLDAPPSVDEFKFRMGYIAKPVRQRVVFHPLIVPSVNHFTQNLVKLARKIQPGWSSLAKLEGMIRFYMEGNLPLSRQTQPIENPEFNKLFINKP
ncbi:MAG: hypothetical protein H0X30_03530 [Anaerolineae bacterium]|nr:hypothetical protein [Anaerolineae bacterium]